MSKSDDKATDQEGMGPEVVDQDHLTDAFKAIRRRLCVRLRGPTYLIAKDGFRLDTNELPELAGSFRWFTPIAAKLGYEVDRHLVAFDGYFHALLKDKNKSGTFAGMEVTPEELHKPLRELKAEVERVANEVANLPPEERDEIDREDKKHLRTAQALSELAQNGIEVEFPSANGGYEEFRVPAPVDLRRATEPEGKLEELHGLFTGMDEEKEALIFGGNTLVYGLSAEQRSRLLNKSAILQVRRQETVARYKKVTIVSLEEQQQLIPPEADGSTHEEQASTSKPAPGIPRRREKGSTQRTKK